MHSCNPVAAIALPLVSATLCAQSFAVVPSQFASDDAIRASYAPGTVNDCRQQLLIGPSHLTNLVGSDISAIEFRRSAAAEQFVGGATDLAVTVSIAPHGPLACSSSFANNIGTNPVQVFSGVVTVPTSPAEAGPQVSWDADNIIRIAFTTPFAYAGGTLCIDLTGAMVASQECGWWATDATYEDLPGSTNDYGGGCGTYVNANGAWSFVAEHSLVPGGHAKMFAYGTPYGLAVAAIGQGTAVGTPLSLLGFNSPAGCDLHLTSIDILTPAVFVPDSMPELASRGGRADLELKMPAIPQALGFKMTTQWLDWSQMATSNAVEWTLAAAIPTLDMAIVEGPTTSPKGRASAHVAPVMRFEYQ